MTTLSQYERARAALAEATKIDEVLSIHDEVEHIKLYAKQIKDQALLADASEFQMRVERRLGSVIAAAKEAGEIVIGRPKKVPPTGAFPARLEDLGLTRHLSSRAQQRASISERAFEAAVRGMRERIAAGRAKIIDQVLSTEEKAERRANRERVLGECQQALPTQKFGVILADPEWRFEPWSRETGMDRAADNHYPTSVTEVIAARDVASIAANDCVLFLWATVPMLPQALLVMGAWGFDYRSNFVWVKDRVGTGYWNRNKHELLLIGVRGTNIPAPAPGTRELSVIEAPVGEHSAKPEIVLEYIEGWYPTLPKIELNRRGPARPGWSAWGNQTLPPHDPQTGKIAA